MPIIASNNEEEEFHYHSSLEAFHSSMELKKEVRDGSQFWRELARQVALAIFTYPNDVSQDENPTLCLVILA